MDFAVVMYFDKQTEEVISRLIYEIIDNGVNDYILEDEVRPHITLGIWNSEDIELAKSKMRILANTNKKFQVRFSSIGIFKKDTYILFLSPVINDMLLQIHNNFYKEFSGISDNFVEYYKNNNWVPHSTLAMNMTEEELLISVKHTANRELQIEARIERLALISCCPYKEIDVYELLPC